MTFIGLLFSTGATGADGIVFLKAITDKENAIIVNTALV
jgi:hypothetical protein